jgi:hypothetical protein
MGAITSTVLWLGLRQHAALAAELQTAPNGLQWIDTIEGTGPAPVKGALIRSVQSWALEALVTFSISCLSCTLLYLISHGMHDKYC